MVLKPKLFASGGSVERSIQGRFSQVLLGKFLTPERLVSIASVLIILMLWYISTALQWVNRDSNSFRTNLRLLETGSGSDRPHSGR